MKNLIYGIILGMIAQALVWVQLYAPYKIEFLSKNKWITYAIAIPITYIFYLCTRNLFQFTDQAWSVRIITFICGVITFYFLNYYFFNEPLNLKNGISLVLCGLILLIQLWKI